MLVPQRPHIDAEAELCWIALTLTPGLGPRRGLRLIEEWPDVREIFHASRKDLENAGLSGSVAQSIASGCTFDEALLQHERALSMGCHILPYQHHLYPQQLRDLPDAPLVLFGLGEASLLNEVNVAVVGTRRPTAYGQAAAYKLSRDLAELEVCVVSGMARGVDTAAHRAALDVGGKTIAVFGCGVDMVYPAENRDLASEIADSGLLLSEFPMGTPAYPQNFPLRNRIVSGLSCGVLVVEGSQYSGSSITARLAMEHGREVFAVPGNITSRMSLGPNLLIKQGATLVQNANDVITQLPSQLRVQLYRKMHPQDEGPALAAPDSEPAIDPLHRKVLAQLRPDEGRLLDELIEQIPTMSSSEIISALFQLEMEGYVRQDVGQRYTRIWC
jgi:DNA processing protein